MTTTTRRRTLWIGLGLSLGLVVVAALIWVGLNLRAQSEPEPLWTEADLPPLPAAHDNAWLAAEPDTLELELPDALDDLVSVGAENSTEFWARAEAHETELADFLASATGRAARARLDATLARTQFAPTCAPWVSCPYLAWRQLHQFALLTVLADALSGDHQAAAERIAALLRLTEAHRASAHTILSLAVALANLGTTLDLAAQLGARAPGDPSVQALASDLRALDLETLDLRPIVIGEYILIRAGIEAVATGVLPGELEPDTPGLDQPLLFNRAQTLELLNERFEERYAAAAAGNWSDALGQREPYTRDTPMWWLRNPAGKTLLDTFILPSSDGHTPFDRGWDRARQARDKALTQLDGS